MSIALEIFTIGKYSTKNIRKQPYH